MRLSWNELLRMYYKYIGVLGSSAPVYRFEAVWHGRAVRTVVREPVQSVRLECTVHNPLLTDGPTWDCAAVSLRAIDQNGNLLPYCGEAVCLKDNIAMITLHNVKRTYRSVMEMKRELQKNESDKKKHSKGLTIDKLNALSYEI